MGWWDFRGPFRWKPLNRKWFVTVFQEKPGLLPQNHCYNVDNGEGNPPFPMWKLFTSWNLCLLSCEHKNRTSMFIHVKQNIEMPVFWKLNAHPTICQIESVYLQPIWTKKENHNNNNNNNNKKKNRNKKSYLPPPTRFHTGQTIGPACPGGVHLFSVRQGRLDHKNQHLQAQNHWEQLHRS